MANNANERGQAVLEFVLSATLLIVIAMGAIEICRAEWQKTRCARFAFEAAHHARIGLPMTPGLWGSGIIATAEPIEGGYRGSARCGAIEESVDLPTLEEGQW
ncbi:MAG: pilus assembly protein [Oligoflexia bacterium]|nr:pilus assembly protein [Oligoflexia bacterium]